MIRSPWPQSRNRSVPTYHDKGLGNRHLRKSKYKRVDQCLESAQNAFLPPQKAKGGSRLLAQAARGWLASLAEGGCVRSYAMKDARVSWTH
ncbi:hypothetical protein CJ030_MR3G026644 [Morella rubra]|uniref:Uncharacterized protein n=1 Tax=Morella rubra TaxID=262757 RepID=A0A6A1W0I8_9ROSI|nr:hypothetical protein CJ030_MR3G026644 [Morella rubra]